MFQRTLPILTAIMIVVILAGSVIAGTGAEAKVVATYFHGTLRCQTCLHIESMARYVLTDVMAEDVQSGLLEWRQVNFDEEENGHLQEEFELEGPALVLTLVKGEEVLQWSRLDRTWDLYEDVSAFDMYVQKMAEEYLLAASEHGGARQD